MFLSLIYCCFDTWTNTSWPYYYWAAWLCFGQLFEVLPCLGVGAIEPGQDTPQANSPYGSSLHHWRGFAEVAVASGAAEPSLDGPGSSHSNTMTLPTKVEITTRAGMAGPCIVAPAPTAWPVPPPSGFCPRRDQTVPPTSRRIFQVGAEIYTCW